MALVVTRDFDATRVQLAAWLATKLPAGAQPTLSALEIPQGAGHSNETLLFEASWGDEGASRTQRFVARVPPGGRGVFPEYDMELQVRCMQTLGAKTTIPVPRVLWFEPDPAILGQPFYEIGRASCRERV